MSLASTKRYSHGILLIVVSCFASIAAAEDQLRPTVGAEGYIAEIILPGSELAPRPISDDLPVVVRVVRTIPHGDSFRYEMQFFGMEPGQYNLVDFLVRKDGSTTEGLAPIPIEILSLLPPGQIEPNALEIGWLPRLGGYRVVSTALAVLWLAALLWLCFGKRREKLAAADTEKPVTLAQLLYPRLLAAQQSKLHPNQYAELERMLIAYWRRRLGLESESPQAALVKIHAHPESGPLMRQLERWMHNPQRNGDFDLRELLEPYQKIPIEPEESPQ
jgi:hypothetical protein